MGETEKTSVLGRIAAAGRDVRQARAMTLPKAMRVTLAKVADALMDLPMAVIGAVVDKMPGDAVEGQLKDDALLMLLDGPDGHVGAAAFDPVLVGGLIQQQTMGTVQPDQGAPRAMTRTDAAICAPLIDMLFERIVAVLDEQEDKTLLEGFRFGAKVEDTRTLAMALDAQDYALVRLTVDVARGARQGEILFVLPLPDPFDQTEGDDDEEDTFEQSSMTDTVMALNADLKMVLCSLHLPLGALQSMSPGDELPVTPGAFPNVQITTSTGRIVGRGIVGHVNGVRAVKPQRKPSHATQPLRRVSDEPLVDMPRVEEIPGPARREGEATKDVTEDDIEAAMAALRPGDPVLGQDVAPEVDRDIANASGLVENLPALADLPHLDDLPDLADLPDLSDLPDLAANGG
ncbi:hypothetical protein KUV51_13815 [Tateyamaria omphalii]|uniref:hypothetical protein n=1 Tax=Tateyamaria omphalii TaxID=299262 RepID=UPI001C999131|nr:hypothetical protein [Tateyamaria omphalii]MBY5934081.1 hypothetical protein [Tateyamaria omphalii]